MNEIQHPRAGVRAVLRWLVAAAFAIAVVLSGSFTGLTHKAGLFFLLGGCAAAALMGFSLREIDAAFRHAAGRPGTRGEIRRSAHFWEAAARNAWILGALGSALSFTGVLGGGSAGLADTGARLIQSFIVTLYGSVLAVVCLVPAMKLAGLAERAPSGGDAAGPAAARTMPVERAMGYVLFAAVLGVTVFSLLAGSPQDGPLPLAKVMLHGPAILVVLGGAVALFLFTGAGTGARGLTLGFAVTGLVALLAGLIQAMLGFAHANIQEVATAGAFIISASTFALLGLGAVAAPLEDREVMDGRRESPGPLSRLFWVVFPLLAFVFLVLTFIMVVTPMTKPGA